MFWLLVAAAAVLVFVPRLRGAVARLGLLALLVASMLPWLGLPSKFEAVRGLNAAKDARVAGDVRAAATRYEAVLAQHPRSTRALVGYACLALHEGYLDQGVFLLQWAFQEGVSLKAFENAGACGGGRLGALGIQIIQFKDDRDFLFPTPAEHSKYPDVKASLNGNAEDFRRNKDPSSLATLQYDLFCLSNETGNKIIAARYLETALRTQPLAEIDAPEKKSLQKCIDEASDRYTARVTPGGIEVLPRGPVHLVLSSPVVR